MSNRSSSHACVYLVILQVYFCLQNAIDGGTSCIISYAASGQDHMVTMTGSFDGRNEGLIMVSGHQLFATAVSLEEKGITVSMTNLHLPICRAFF